jgi:hypothetical protein
MNKPPCHTPGCGRRRPRGSRFCGACRRAIPRETWIAWDGVHDAWRRAEAWGIPAADRQEWQTFLQYTWSRLLDLAALQAWAARKLDTRPGEVEQLAAAVGVDIWEVRFG